MLIKSSPGLVLASVVLFTGCTALPDVSTFASATQRMNSTTDEAFTAAGDVFDHGMLVTLELKERRAATCGRNNVKDEDLVRVCQEKGAEPFPGCPSLEPAQRDVRTGLLCMELAHRRLALFQGAAASYSGSLAKVVESGNNGKKAAESLVGAVNGIGGVLTGSGLIGKGATELFSSFYGEVAKRRARNKLQKVLPATDTAVEELHGLLQEALGELEKSFEAGSDALRARLLNDKDRDLVSTRARIDASRNHAKDFLFKSKLEPEDPEALGAFLEELETVDQAFGESKSLADLKPSIVFFCNEGVTSLEHVVCGTEMVRYKGTECEGEEDDETACCLVEEGCCTGSECTVRKVLAARVKYWAERKKTMDAADKEFPKDRLKRYLTAEESYRTTDRDTRALLAAARLSVASWRRAHAAVAGSVKPKERE